MARQNSYVELGLDELVRLETLLSKGVHSSRVLNRARILLWNHQKQSLAPIAQQLNLCYGGVCGIVRDYREGGLDYALYDAPRSGAPPKITERVEAYVTAIACSDVPEGHVSWTVEMIKDELIRLDIVDTLSKTSTHTILKKVNSSLGNRICGVSKK